MNNPIRLIDPDGMSSGDPNGDNSEERAAEKRFNDDVEAAHAEMENQGAKQKKAQNAWAQWTVVYGGGATGETTGNTSSGEESSAVGPELASTDPTVGLSTLGSNTSTENANQGGQPVGFKMFVNLIMSEASTQKDAAGIGSVLINRMIAVGTDLNNPNWINKIGTKSQYAGFTNGQYKKADKMSLSDIQNDPDFKYMYRGALKAFNNWGTDFTGMPAGHPSYYWNTAGFDGGGPALDLFRRGKAILNTIDGIDFYSFKNPKGRWTPN
jgi:hypothetical protein